MASFKKLKNGKVCASIRRKGFRHFSLVHNTREEAVQWAYDIEEYINHLNLTEKKKRIEKDLMIEDSSGNVSNVSLYLKEREKKKQIDEDLVIEDSSGNVFLDMGFEKEEAEELFKKAEEKSKRLREKRLKRTK